MKRLIFLVLTMVLLLTGCGNKKQEAKDDSWSNVTTWDNAETVLYENILTEEILYEDVIVEEIHVEPIHVKGITIK